MVFRRISLALLVGTATAVLTAIVIAIIDIYLSGHGNRSKKWFWPLKQMVCWMNYATQTGENIRTNPFWLWHLMVMFTWCLALKNRTTTS